MLSICKHDKTSNEFKHGLLSQWRGYAQYGGFAIEFDEQQLDALLTLEMNEHAYLGYKSDNVRYERFDELFDRNIYRGVAGEMIRSAFNASGIDVSDVITGQVHLDKIVGIFVFTAPFLKHWGFQEEREYRIVALSARRRKLPKSHNGRYYSKSLKKAHYIKFISLPEIL